MRLRDRKVCRPSQRHSVWLRLLSVIVSGGKGFHFRKSDPPEVGYNFYDMPMPSMSITLINTGALSTCIACVNEALRV